jgi:FHA domain
VATCPSGHQSASDDFCDVCGVLIGAAPSLAPDAAPAEAAWAGSGAGTGAGPGVNLTGAGLVPDEPCPRCGVPRAGQFCESCGYDFTVAGQDTFPPGTYLPAPSPPGPPLPSSAPPAPPAPAAAPLPVQGPGTQPPPGAPVPPAAEWTAVVSADRAYYDSVQAAGGPDAAGIAFPAYCPQRRFRLAGNEVRIGRHSSSSGIDPEIDLSVPPADPGVSRLHAVLLKAPDGTWSVIDPGSANGTAVNGSEIPQGQAVPLRDGDRVHLGAWTVLRVVREA